MHTPTHTLTSTAALRGAAIAIVPPAASMAAAASCAGASEEPVNRDNDRNPSAAEVIAAHTHSDPTMSMRPQ
jgi:hypothetical protein